ncbi:unnamed protein product, partial [Musa banksii]
QTCPIQINKGRETLLLHLTPSHSCSSPLSLHSKVLPIYHGASPSMPPCSFRGCASDLVVVANPAIIQMAIQATIDSILLSPIQ